MNGCSQCTVVEWPKREKIDIGQKMNQSIKYQSEFMWVCMSDSCDGGEAGEDEIQDVCTLMCFSRDILAL